MLRTPLENRALAGATINCVAVAGLPGPQCGKSPEKGKAPRRDCPGAKATSLVLVIATAISIPPETRPNRGFPSASGVSSHPPASPICLCRARQLDLWAPRATDLRVLSAESHERLPT